MNNVLENYLPPELCDIIAREVHRLYLVDLHKELLHNVIWVLAENKVSFWVVRFDTNYYFSLLDDQEQWNIVYKKYKNISI